MTATATTATLFIGAERPGLDVFWLDTTKQPVDLSTGGWTFAVSIEQDDVETVMAGATVTAYPTPTIDRGLPADIPTCDISFAAGSLNHLSVGTAIVRVNATLAGRPRRWKQTVKVDQ